ncbi:molecular chaperone HtpG [Tumidithrix helvetica PCC 7403]|uniref:molecular chaperone HtpG n=1 Tax=Tumidithrix helvetica TaxID=3457545 RepID=UPI003C98E75B
MLEQGTISIHTENIFPIIKKALYSERDIFLRELISNGVDAISKLKMVSYAGEATDIPEPEISVSVDKEKRTIAITDNGIGMTADEVRKYINQVAFSSAEEFISKYTNSGSGDQQIIGHFGLGFYSAFMVASRVEIDTLSYQKDAEAVHWSCDGTTTFTLDESDRKTIGTTITLTLQEDAEEFLEVGETKRIIRNYCDFIPVSIKLNDEVVNKQTALWDRSPSSVTKDEYLEFYRYLYPFQDDPLFWIHLNTDYPFIIKGILYFPKIKADIDPNKGQIKLYCNHVFVSDNCEEVIPRFLLPLRGTIDSSDIPLNVSRSFLQGDRKVRKIQDYIAKKVGDYLCQLYTDSREEFLKCWKDISLFMKFGSMNSDKFYQQVKEILVYPTTYEAETDNAEIGHYTTLQAYLERSKEKHENQIFYSSDAIAQATYIDLHKSQGLEVLTFDTFIDSHFIHFLEGEFRDVKFARVDADIDDRLINQDSKTELVDPATNQTKSDRIQELFRRALNKPKLVIRTEALKADDSASSPPAMILLPEATRRMQEMAALLQQTTNTAFPEDHILLVNTSHPLIQNLLNLDQNKIVTAAGQPSESSGLADLICNHVYDLALMVQKSFDANSMKAFLERSNTLLTQLTK